MLYSNTIPAKNNQIIPVFYDGRPMHSKYDPLREAENFVQNIKKSDFFVVAGIGAGYHIKKISEKFPESVILAVENSNLELDFLRKNISEIKTIENQKNIYFSTLTDFPEKLKNLYVPAVYDKINLVEHKAWSTANSENYSRLVELFKNSIRDISSDFSTQAHFGKLWTRNILQNLKHINNEKKFNFPINKTALIVAAGPSLDNFLHNHLENLNEYYIIATDTAHKILTRNKIIPDAVFSVDGQSISTNHFSNDFSYKSNNIIYIFELTANHSVVKKICNKTKNYIFTFSSHPLEVFAANFSKDSLIHIDSKSGTVTIAAIDFAKSAGFSKIVVAGADFAYSNGKSYAKGSYLDDLYLKDQYKTHNQETSYSQLMYRTKLMKIDQTKYTTETLNSYRIALETWLKNNNYDADFFDNCYHLSAKITDKKNAIVIKTFNYSSFVNTINSVYSDNHTIDKANLKIRYIILLPVISYLKKRDMELSGNLKFFEDYVKLARNFILRYT